jgi:CheY-like chemotaxis protein
MPNKTKLLVVDDDEAVLAALKTKLERTGRFEVFTANGGDEALRRVREVSPDVVMSDIDMPDMDGGELAQALREKPATAKLPVIFLSSMVSPTEATRYSGGSPILSKRTTVEEVVKTVEQVLKQST